MSYLFLYIAVIETNCSFVNLLKFIIVWMFVEINLYPRKMSARDVLSLLFTISTIQENSAIFMFRLRYLKILHKKFLLHNKNNEVHVISYYTYFVGVPNSFSNYVQIIKFPSKQIQLNNQMYHDISPNDKVVDFVHFIEFSWIIRFESSTLQLF